MRYWLYVFLLFPYSLLVAGGSCSTSNEEKRRTEQLYTEKAREILERFVILSPDKLASVAGKVAPRDYHIEVWGLQQQRRLTVADYLKECEADRDERAREIISYFHKRDGQIIEDTYKIELAPDVQKDRTEIIFTCMQPLMSGQ